MAWAGIVSIVSPPDVSDPNAAIPHVVIIGGGFGGLQAARRLAKLGPTLVRVTLIDRRNHHLFQPLLYQVATAALSPSDIAHPIRAVARGWRNVRVVLAEARAIDPVHRCITLDDGELHYDYLIVAVGATHSYFGKPWAALAPGLKSVEDALEMRRRILLAYEAAERETDPERQRAWLTFVVVGGGPTGVELAGALGEIGMQTLAHDFRRIDPTRVRVVLVEGQSRILGAFKPKLSTAAAAALTKRHVEVEVDSYVTDVDEFDVVTKHGETSQRIEARTVLWAAGVQASPLAAQLGAPTDRSGRVQVAADLSIEAYPEIFAIGDAAMVMSDGVMVPGMAQGAIQGGQHAAKIIAGEVIARRRNLSLPRRPRFRYHDKGSMAAVGRAVAVVQTKRFTTHGVMAWLMWWVVHVIALVGFRNRFFVLLQWAWSWLTFQRGARLITGAAPAALPAIYDDDVALPTAMSATVVPAPRADALP